MRIRSNPEMENTLNYALTAINYEQVKICKLAIPLLRDFSHIYVHIHI